MYHLKIYIVPAYIRACLDTVYYWKYCNKIIFKCVNSAMELNFKVFFFFAEKNKCKSREQCTGPTVFSKTQEHTFSVCSKCTLNVKIKCLFGFGVCIFQVRVFFFFLVQRLVHYSWNMNSASRQMHSIFINE